MKGWACWFGKVLCLKRSFYVASSSILMCPHWQLSSESGMMCWSKPLLQKCSKVWFLVLVLYVDDLLFTCNEPLIIWVRGRWLLNIEIMNLGMVNRFFEVLKRRSILQIYLLETSNLYHWTLRLNFKKLERYIVEPNLATESGLKHWCFDLTSILICCT